MSVGNETSDNGKNSSPTVNSQSGGRFVSRTRGPAGRMPFVGAAVAFLLFAALLFLYGRALGVGPGSLVSTQNDVIFSSDAGSRWRELSGIARPKLSVSHPLLSHMWGRIGGSLRRALRLATSDERANVYAAWILTCAIAAIGAASLVYFALRQGTSVSRVALLAPVLLMSSANVIMALPEHQAISFGLLGAALLCLLPFGNPVTIWKRIGPFLVLMAVVAGTTSTNVVFMILIGAQMMSQRGLSLISIAQKYRKYFCIMAGLVLALAVAVICWKIDDFRQGDSQVHLFLNWRLIRDPLAAIQYAMFGIVGPVVGPTPSVTLINQHVALTYEPIRLTAYGWVSGIAAGAWLTVLVFSTRETIRKTSLRSMAFTLIAWIGWNLVFHNIWGDEFFLYSPHWLGALMLLALLGAQSFTHWQLGLLVLPIVVGQFETLVAIRQLIQP